MQKKLINRKISRLYRQNLRFFALKLKEYSLPLDVSHIPVIMQVYNDPGITQDKISSNAKLDKGTTARCLKQLEENEIIYRQIDKDDRRINHIFATSKGMEIKEKVFLVIFELHDVLYQGFSDDDIDIAINLTEKMISNMEAHLNNY